MAPKPSLADREAQHAAQASGMVWDGYSATLYVRLAREDEAIARESDRGHRATTGGGPPQGPPPLPAEARLLESQLEQYLAAVAHHLMWLRREVLMLASIVEQQGAWKRRQEDFMVAQGQEVIRLAAAVARLEQGFTQYELVTVELVTPLAIG
ncbi:TPA: hypothetical protein ACH3X1_011289 [Trebouxia sp. C0004]